MTTYETLLYDVKDHIGVLTLNRPESINAVNRVMMDELEDFWNQRKQDENARVIVLTGGGEKGFCSGLDIKEAFSQTAEYDITLFYRSQQRMARTLVAMRQCPQPIIAAVHGAAAGIGFSLALGADLRVITPKARFAASYINIGFGGADIGSSYFLPRLIGAGRAYEFLLTGEFMDADTAMNLGLVSRVVEKQELLPTAMHVAGIMCLKNPLGLRLTKEAINVNLDAGGLEQALHLEDRNQSMCFTTIRYESQG
jgi:enoyl-CoA hydratase/carnithine racemase